ncbi:MAG: exodeoxyribonuclease III [Actinomycetes bacterium]|jgi:exodeoxyribonuclease-3|nr:exodeoxyribonuclease III [Actinomycetes bacterium]
MKLVSWNVNGLRAVVKKGFADVFAALDADVFCVQETKLQARQIDLELPGYTQVWSYAEKKGYSGTAVFTRTEPVQVLRAVGDSALDAEGRLTACEFEDYWVVCEYAPNAQPELARIAFRERWEDAFRDFVSELDADKPVIICGDLNVAHQPIDLARPAPNVGKPGFSDEERAKFGQLLNAGRDGIVDCFRERHPDVTGAYTWWSYRANARANNVGWRIDYVLCSRRMFSRVQSTPLYPEVLGSDHCPVGLVLG